MGLKRRHYTVGLSDAYKEYVKRREDDGEEVIKYRVYRGILVDFFIAIFQKIITENFIFTMPNGLGTISVASKKSNADAAYIDWAATRKVGKIVKHLNLHTFGHYFYIYWNKTYRSFRNRPYYRFKASSSIKAGEIGVGKKGLSKHIMEVSNDPERRSYLKL